MTRIHCPHEWWKGSPIDLINHQIHIRICLLCADIRKLYEMLGDVDPEEWMARW